MLHLQPAISSSLFSTLLVHSPAFFLNLPRVFPVLALAKTGSCVGPQNKIGHPAHHYRQFIRPDIIPGGWLGSKHELLNFFSYFLFKLLGAHPSWFALYQWRGEKLAHDVADTLHTFHSCSHRQWYRQIATKWQRSRPCFGIHLGSLFTNEEG